MSKKHKHKWYPDDSNRVAKASGKPAVVRCGESGCDYYISYSAAVSYKAMKHNWWLVLTTVITAIIALLSFLANLFTVYQFQKKSQNSIENLIQQQNNELKKIYCAIKYDDDNYVPLECTLVEVVNRPID